MSAIPHEHAGYDAAEMSDAEGDTFYSPVIPHGPAPLQVLAFEGGYPDPTDDRLAQLHAATKPEVMIS